MKNSLLLISLFVAGIISPALSQPLTPEIAPRLPEEKSIELGSDIRLRYVEQGDPDGVPVIFLHGYTDSWHSFEGVLTQLPSRYRAFAISQRGHGNSDRPQAGYAAKDFAADVAAFIKKKNLRKVIVAGHSMGGIVAQRFVLDHPQLVKGLVIIASAATLDDNTAVKEFEKEVDKLIDPVDREFAAGFQTATITNPVPAPYLELVINESMKLPAFVWKQVAHGMFNYNFVPELQKIAVPTLLVWGDKDSFFPREGQDLLQKSIKGSKLLVYEGVGHAIHWEVPVRFTNDIVQFFDSLK
jgi:non-heme chloroperoxidase